ncbi:hypothetical protein ACFE04_001980 [Oxalis oulophora]
MRFEGIISSSYDLFHDVLRDLVFVLFAASNVQVQAFHVIRCLGLGINGFSLEELFVAILCRSVVGFSASFITNIVSITREPSFLLSEIVPLHEHFIPSLTVLLLRKLKMEYRQD